MAGPVSENAPPSRTPTIDDIVALWLVRRLAWRDLPRSVAVPVAAIGVLVALTSLVLVAIALQVPLPAPLTVPSISGGQPETVDAAIIALIWLALAVLSAAALTLAGRSDATRARLTMVGVAVVMFTFLADLVTVGDAVLRYDSAGLVQGSLAIWRVYQGAGWIGIAASVAILFLPRRFLGASPIAPVLLGAVPYLLGLAAFVAAGAVTYRLPGSADLLSTQGLAARPFVDNGQILTYGLVLIVFWKAATWARAGAQLIGLRVSALAQRWRSLFWIVLAAKVGFLATGYLSAGTCQSGGPFADSRCDDPLAWLITACFAAAVTLWLIRPERWPITASRLPAVAAAVVFGFAGVVLPLVLLRPVIALAGFVEIGGRVSTPPFPACLASSTGITPLVSCAFHALDGLVDLSSLVTVALALLVGAVLLARRSAAALPVGLPLLVFGMWAAPRALGVFEIQLLHVSPGDVPPLGFELTTFDTVLTVFVGFAALAFWRRAMQSQLATTLTLVLVVSLLMAHGSTLIPAGWAPALFVLMLPVPIFYVLLVDSSGLNDAGVARPTEVLGFMVISGSLLILATAAVSLHTINPGENAFESVASVLFLAPFAMITVAALITDIRRAAGQVTS